MKLLIIRFSSIGDIVLTTPVIRALKQQIHAEVHYASKVQYAGLLNSNPYIDKVHLLENRLGDLIKILRAERFDCIIDLHNNLRTRIIAASLQVKTFRFNKLNIEKWLMVNFKINRLPNVHIVDRYLDTTRSLGVRNDGGGLDFFIPEMDQVKLETLPETHSKGYVAYAIGGQHATKKLPVERMIELCEKIAQPVVLLGGKEDFDNGERVRLFFERDDSGRKIIFNSCGTYNLNQSASVINEASLVYTHDTGLMHIAAALKKEIIAIWGNTIPAFGMYPYRTKFANWENNNLSCRPCSKIGYDKCPKGHFKCMRELPFGDVRLGDLVKDDLVI